MKDKILELIKNYDELSLIEKNYSFLDDDHPDQRLFYHINGFGGLLKIPLVIHDEEDLKVFEKIVDKRIKFLPEYFAIEYDNKIEVLLTPINIRTSHIGRRFIKKNTTKIELNYFKNKLAISIQYESDSSSILEVSKLVGRRTRPFIFTIENYKFSSISGKENDVRNILNCVLFDLGYTYNLIFEPLNIENINRRTPTRRRNKTDYPQEKINIIYKDYIPELIEYFNIGEKVDYPPFRFICYFHIIEYFSDKSAYFHASERLKSLMLKPDFHINTDKYVNQAINFFKLESTKNTSDKIKIRRVISQFINKGDFEEYLKDIEMFDYFTKPITIQCSKPLSLKPIDFDSDGKFQESLMNRIYSLRCSIVHSNPDFDESKAVPFSPTITNMEILRKEIEMIYEVARTIILESSK